MSVAVVTDSTAGLSAQTLAQADTRHIPLRIVGIPVLLGALQRREGRDISSAQVTEALNSRKQPVTTSRLSPGELSALYRQLLDQDGFDAVVSIHLASALSGTVEAARLAAAEFDGRVHVVDSRGVGMGLGYPVLEAVSASEAGAAREDVASAAERARQRVSTYFYVDTLEYLRRGGRISAAAALVGTALSVKPILQVTATGQIQVCGKVRTPLKGVKTLTSLAVTDAESQERLDVTVHHLGAAARAQTLATELQHQLGSQIANLQITEVGAAVGAHCGPGLVGVVVHRRPGELVDTQKIRIVRLLRGLGV
ncbi:DegV family protein [Natronoglycomyces albus]|uniref:DegV family protein n=1 Tax=Natronoglycomyces albus TaxID=2811108 RepID=A0A895XF61_9ACTN|nr:DegV family protein [Natronoglycomyces albus]QSB04481.1 DegV family protein [Natronoglycomyces albus]